MLAITFNRAENEMEHAVGRGHTRPPAPKGKQVEVNTHDSTDTERKVPSKRHGDVTQFTRGPTALNKLSTSTQLDYEPREETLNCRDTAIDIVRERQRFNRNSLQTESLESYREMSTKEEKKMTTRFCLVKFSPTSQCLPLVERPTVDGSAAWIARCTVL